MGDLLELVRNGAADSALAFREQVYRRGQQGELLRDMIGLANAAAAGPRFLILGVDDSAGKRRIPGITPRSWKSFCEALPDFLARAVEPPLRFSLETLNVEGSLVGAVCVEPCEDPPYLLARRVSAHMPAGGGWIRRGTRVRRLLRRHLERIFAARFRSEAIGDIAVGFPGELPREEIELPVLPLDALPSAAAAQKLERMLNAKRVSRSVLGSEAPRPCA
jgi:predicted HTH transcriptional regulator